MNGKTKKVLVFIVALAMTCVSMANIAVALSAQTQQTAFSTVFGEENGKYISTEEVTYNVAKTADKYLNMKLIEGNIWI